MLEESVLMSKINHTKFTLFHFHGVLKVCAYEVNGGNSLKVIGS